MEKILQINVLLHQITTNGANGKKYKSDYRAILNWVIDKIKQDNNRNIQGGMNDFKEIMEEAKNEQTRDNTSNNTFGW